MPTDRAASPPAVVAERPAPGLDVPLWVHPGWAERFPWLVQGTTGAGTEAEPFDLGLSGGQPVGAALERWTRLQGATAMRLAVHSRQVHGAELATHAPGSARGVLVTRGVDGHLTAQAGVLLTVSVADCVPVSLVDARRRAVALVHSGWRGTAAGIAGRALERLVGDGTDPADVWAHCGPAICGRCYEVSPEVHAAVRPEWAPPPAPRPIDLRAQVAERLAGAGVPPEQITTSAHCTRCGPGEFFSHRAGSSARQMGVLGIRE